MEVANTVMCTRISLHIIAMPYYQAMQWEGHSIGCITTAVLTEGAVGM